MDKEEYLVNLHYLPIILFVSLPTVFVLTYVIAVLYDHVEAGFPYISDVATSAPESCIFAQFMNMIAALMCFVIYIRYSQVKECTSAFRLQASLPRWNYWALILGLMTTLGVSIVANFQETSVIVVHMIGAVLCFGGGTAYFWTQAVCSFYLHPLGCSLRMAHLRMALSTFCTVCFFVIFITGVLASLAYKGTNPQKWYKGDGGWELHVASTRHQDESSKDHMQLQPSKIQQPGPKRKPRLSGLSGTRKPNDHLIPHQQRRRYREYRDALLDNVAPLIATTPPNERRTDDLCPVQIHVHDSAIRERRREGLERRKERDQKTNVAQQDDARRWIDLDENVLDGYILIDDGCVESAVIHQERDFPDFEDGSEDVDFGDDADSHGNYDSDMYAERPWPRRARLDLDPGATYPLANSHGNAYRESSSHNEYSRLYSEISARKEIEDRRHQEDGDYAIANSHGDHSPGIRGRSCSGRLETDRLILWNPKPDPNYEIANSHSNYRVFYDSQTQHPNVQQPAWPTGSWRDDLEKNQDSTGGDGANTGKKKGLDTGKSPRSKKLKNESEDTTCDIEQCLVQIEESLLNIEQNLLHVQDLDLPELRNLLYKSPSIERSLYEMQDLLYAESIVPVIKRSKSLSLESDEDDDEEEEEEEEEEEAWVGEKLTIKDDDDEDGDANPYPFGGSNEESSDTTNQDENNPSRSTDDPTSNDWVEDNTGLKNEPVESNIPVEQSKSVNFVPNSLSKTPSRRAVLDENKENIRLCWSEPEDPTVDYNLNNSCSEKKLHCRDKCHTRTNSLDENPSFKDTELVNKHTKTSLQNIFLEQKSHRLLNSSDKAKSDGTLQAHRERSSSSSRDDGKRNKERRRRRSSNENRLLARDDKNEDFRRKIESMMSYRRSTISNLDHHKKPMKTSTESIERERSRSSDRSPAKSKKTSVSMERIHEKDSAGGKGFGGEKKKRKKGSGRSQSSSENALVPGKLISLSLSLLLAALLQAVRCLTDLVEDAFRSVSYDRNGLLQ
ncbi:hypothetical protein KPH14_010887 [Odynerus spinipes]|uniref:CWH43-like N-terminal domain-containing protein n=1 Tax=Odynerus spinipes TaxID=1348599 RepID=A0AAD9RH31_9HYME|nr:hypothetical protein KPH14_010887 [Odynerus spinipes]